VSGELRKKGASIFAGVAVAPLAGGKGHPSTKQVAILGKKPLNLKNAQGTTLTARTIHAPAEMKESQRRRPASKKGRRKGTRTSSNILFKYSHEEENVPLSKKIRTKRAKKAYSSGKRRQSILTRRGGERTNVAICSLCAGGKKATQRRRS